MKGIFSNTQHIMTRRKGFGRPKDAVLSVSCSVSLLPSVIKNVFVQGRILTAQSSVNYALDIANALVFLRMQGYVHTELSSKSIMITANDAAKLADLSPCLKLPKARERREKGYEVYSPEPQYATIDG